MCIAIAPKNTEISFLVHIAQPYIRARVDQVIWSDKDQFCVGLAGQQAYYKLVLYYCTPTTTLTTTC